MGMLLVLAPILKQTMPHTEAMGVVDLLETPTCFVTIVGRLVILRKSVTSYMVFPQISSLKKAKILEQPLLLMVLQKR